MEKIEDLLNKMVKENASDLILEAGAPAALRINGDLRFDRKPYAAAELKTLLLSMLSPEQQARLEKDRQIDFSYELPSGERFRSNVHYQRGSLAAAIRAVPNVLPDRKILHLPEVVEDLANLESGLIIVTGPTGSGKTTTQASIVELINRKRAAHIITIEDPIEYMFKNNKSVIEQREIGSDANDFPSALRAAVRENPDVILIGEMRDLETISTAVTAAETGHLILSNLHTANATNAIDRIIDVFPSHQQNQIRNQLALCLQAVIAQQLIPKIDKSGLIIAVEYLKVTPAVQNLIRRNQTYEIPSLMAVGKKYGMQSMDESLANLYKKDLISMDQALVRSTDPEAFKKRIG
ncbi:MAG: type IV pilus twitching motility protein PilT [Candidatus Margulisbacteria bacterium]|nr:type IV pilus twitching motility protein PilT [Candidatus Margulisiibacteriota bacterium]MBU1022273.1 type IV pilus twitching motility protein PilT [Candidatus Margulisiibacteriota bacterium]MBU1729288.1 type IV pilus twitching motility protein PilT [Candidatus Margulisiibacteriota bacterium]MBU1955561.1 type IV pilus twitching motility protein PilT [Candidatus Margulisiibacteriota bacterium]